MPTNNSSTINSSITLTKKLDFNLLQKTPKEVIKSLKLTHEKNRQFFEALHRMDLIEIEKLLKEDYPKDFNFLTQEELEQVKGSVDSFSEDWDDVISEILYQGIKEVCSKPENEKLLALLADYSIHKSGIWSAFRGIYFTFIKNEKIAFNHALLLYETCTHLSQDNHYWMKSILCNKNNNLFDVIFEIHKKHSVVSLSGYKIIESLIHNQKSINSLSWIKYFDYYVDFFIKQEEKTHAHTDKVLGPIHSVCYYLLDTVLGKVELKAHIEKYYNKTLGCKYEFNEQVVIIIDKKIKQLVYLYDYDEKNNFKQSSRNLYYKKSIIKNLEIKLLEGVQSLIKENSPDKCYKMFKGLSLDEKYYQPIVLMQSLESLNNSEISNAKIEMKNRKI